MTTQGTPPLLNAQEFAHYHRLGRTFELIEPPKDVVESCVFAVYQVPEKDLVLDVATGTYLIEKNTKSSAIFETLCTHNSRGNFSVVQRHEITSRHVNGDRTKKNWDIIYIIS